VDEATGNVVQAVLALLGIGATVFLAVNARSGPRHRVENLRLAAETLEKTNDPAAREMIARFIDQEAVKLEDRMHPDTRDAREYFTGSACFYLAAFGLLFLLIWSLSGDDSLDPGVWVLFVPILLLVAIAFGLFTVGMWRYTRASTRRRQSSRSLDKPFRMDDAQREPPAEPWRMLHEWLRGPPRSKLPR